MAKLYPERDVMADIKAETIELNGTSETAQPSLYERLGGVYNIAVVVDDFIDRVMTDPRLNANPSSMQPITASPPPASSIW